MARPKTISDEAILDAARELFHTHGFAATTAQVAEKAGVSEGSIFRRFPSKQALFIAAMGISQPSWFERVEPKDVGDFWQHMTLLSREILEFMFELIPKVVMLHCTVKTHEVPDDAPPIIARRKLCAFFAFHESESRFFQTPEVATELYFGALHHYAFSSFIGINNAADREIYIETLLQMLGAPEKNL